MKIIYRFICISLFFILLSCGSKTAYWNALPEQSAAIASIDIIQLAHRAGLNEEQGEQGIQQLKDMVKSGLEGSGQLIDRVFADATETGIDFKSKIYVFSSDENAILGFLAKVGSRSKLEDVLESLSKEQLCLPSRDTDGCNWTIIGKWLLAYSDDALLVLSDNKWSDPSKLVRQASMWLRQDGGQGFASKPDFVKLQEANADVALWTSLQLLPRKVITPLIMGLSAELDLKKIKAITTINFESGKIVLDVDPLITDPIVCKLMDEQSRSMEPIEGAHMDLFPAKTQFWISANLQGNDFYQFMRDIPAIRKSFDYTELPISLDWGRIFEAIDGDVSFTITDNFRKDYILWADVKQTEFLRFFTDLKPMIAKTNGMLLFEERGENAYCFAAHDGSVMNLRPGAKIFYLGVKNNRFYVTSNEKLIDQRVLGLSLRDKEWGKRVSGKKFFAVSDWKSLQTFEYFLQKELLTKFPKEISTHMNYLTIESADGKHVTCTIEQQNKNKSLIQLVFGL